jgi:hypothetical protein
LDKEIETQRKLQEREEKGFFVFFNFFSFFFSFLLWRKENNEN